MYNPGVSNISGQLIGQGIQAGAGALAQGIQQYQQNKMLASQAIGRFEGAARANPDILQFLQSDKAPPEIAKAFAKMGKQGNLDVKNAALLAQFADTYTAEKQQAQVAQFRQKQLQMMDAQAQAAQREAEQDAKDAQALNAAFGSGKAFDVRSYLQSGGSVPGLKKLGLDLDRMLAPQNVLTFKSEAELNKAFPKESYDYTFTPNEDGSVTVVGGKVSPRAPVNNLPPGFEPSPTGGIQPMKGSEADIKRQEAEAAKQARIANETTRADVILNAIGSVIPKVDAFTAGFGGSALNKISGTPARDVAAMIDTIKANIGFEQLQKMREASPTGGALGQVAVKELDFLQASLGNLSTEQSPKQLTKSLGEIKRHYERWKQAVQGIDPDKAEKAAELELPSGWSIR